MVLRLLHSFKFGNQQKHFSLRVQDGFKKPVSRGGPRAFLNPPCIGQVWPNPRGFTVRADPKEASLAFFRPKSNISPSRSLVSAPAIASSVTITIFPEAEARLLLASSVRPHWIKHFGQRPSGESDDNGAPHSLHSRTVSIGGP
jgi:hypothetical protein